MDITDWQKKKIETIAEYQETIADIYTILSEKFPALQIQLLSIALRNIRYGDWLRSLTPKIIRGDYQYVMMRFKIESVSTGLNYLRQIFSMIHSDDIGQKKAIGIIKSVEMGDIAMKFYEIVNADNDYANELEKMKNIIKNEKMNSLQTLNKFAVKSGNTGLNY